mgnify:CR=1 FL=1
MSLPSINLYNQLAKHKLFKKSVNFKLDRIKLVLKKSIHVTLLNPFHIYSDHNFISGETYYITETHDKLVPVRIIYTLIIYIDTLYDKRRRV